MPSQHSASGKSSVPKPAWKSATPDGFGSRATAPRASAASSVSLTERTRTRPAAGSAQSPSISGPMRTTSVGLASQGRSSSRTSARAPDRAMAPSTYARAPTTHQQPPLRGRDASGTAQTPQASDAACVRAARQTRPSPDSPQRSATKAQVQSSGDFRVSGAGFRAGGGASRPSFFACRFLQKSLKLLMVLLFVLSVVRHARAAA